MKFYYLRYAQRLPALCEMIEQELGPKLEKLATSKEFDLEVFLAFDGQYRQLSAVVALLAKIHGKFERSIRRVKRLEHGSLFFGLPSKEELVQTLQELKEDFRRYQEPVVSVVSNFSPEEVKRLDEAFFALRAQYYWSTIVNSVVAFENRLLVLLRRRNLKYLETLDKNLGFMFGELSKVYLQNQDKFTHLISSQYEDLLKLVESYRLLFAHPDQFPVDEGRAETLFTQILQFLCDPDCQPPKKPGPEKKKPEDTFLV
ncbi:MAG: hypothetical protein ACFE89_06055 [Candidatus Hodarchaeota archaeon]